MTERSHTPNSSSSLVRLYLALACFLMIFAGGFLGRNIFANDKASELVGVAPDDPVPCSTPGTKSRLFAWSANQTIHVTLNSSQFTPAEMTCLETAFTNWNNSKSANGSNVTLSVTRSSQPVVTRASNGSISATGSNVYQVNKGVPWIGQLDSGVTGGAANSTNRDNAITSINPGVTNCTALTQTMAHEIGHTFGLDECNGCGHGTSVMTGRTVRRIRRE
jgi:hypothetical protein